MSRNLLSSGDSFWVDRLGRPLFRRALACSVVNGGHKSCLSLRKHAYSNVQKILPPKTEKNQIKKLWYFSYFCSKHRLWVHISALIIDCGNSLEPPRRGGSNEYPQSTFLSRNKKNNVYPRKPQFYYIKVGFKGVKICRYVFVMSSACMECNLGLITFRAQQ